MRRTAPKARCGCQFRRFLLSPSSVFRAQVSWAVYKSYIVAAGGTWVAVAILGELRSVLHFAYHSIDWTTVGQALAMLSNLGTNNWLATWSDENGKWLVL